MDCRYCQRTCIKAGFHRNGVQKFYCKPCKKYQQATYSYRGYEVELNTRIKELLVEGMSLRGIGRVLNISLTTVIARIKAIARTISKPLQFVRNSCYELDELWTYTQRKSHEVWVMYIIDRMSKAVIDFRVGSRTKINLQSLTDPLMLLEPRMIYTDRLLTYRTLVPECLHNTTRMGTRHIERHNLNLRTHLKRLSRKTICFSKSMEMLESCLRIYFWGRLKFKNSIAI
jgi:insertion element IS1 protein InsB